MNIFHEPAASVRLAVLLLTSALLAACYLPPFVLPEQEYSVAYTSFSPGAVPGAPTFTGIAAFSNKPVTPRNIAIPPEAKKVSILNVTLRLKISNNGPLPLSTNIFLDRATLSDAALYAGQSLGGPISLPVGGQPVNTVLSLDPALLQNDNLKLGNTFSSPGTPNYIAVKDTDKVSFIYSVLLSARVF